MSYCPHADQNFPSCPHNINVSRPCVWGRGSVAQRILNLSTGETGQTAACILNTSTKRNWVVSKQDQEGTKFRPDPACKLSPNGTKFRPDPARKCLYKACSCCSGCMLYTNTLTLFEYCILENPCARRMRLANRFVVTLSVRNTNVTELPGCTELCAVKHQLW